MSIDTSVGRVDGVRVSIDTSVQVSGQGSGSTEWSLRIKPVYIKCTTTLWIESCGGGARPKAQAHGRRACEQDRVGDDRVHEERRQVRAAGAFMS